MIWQKQEKSTVDILPLPNGIGYKMDGLSGKKVLITGASGFLGSHLVDELKTRKDIEWIITPSHHQMGLMNPRDIEEGLELYKPHTVIHLAAVCGGIGANQAEPGRFFYENLMMGAQLIEQSRRFGIEKFVQVGTVCAYPKFCPVPFKEEDIWNGYPEETNAPYGIAKKALLVQLQAYRQQYGFNGIYLVPVNLYGPRDNFDAQTSHVIPAMIRKMVDAKIKGLPSITLWGTGQASREFLYVKDAVQGIIKATESYDKPEPVNLGTGKSLSICMLSAVIATIVGYNGEIVFDSGKPDGQPQRRLDISRAHEEFGFLATTSLAAGLKETVDYYLESPSEHQQLWSV